MSNQGIINFKVKMNYNKFYLWKIYENKKIKMDLKVNFKKKNLLI